jgi:ADP-ribosylglycohydrolase
MLGAILGDIVGSIYESPSRTIKHKDFPLFGPGCTPTDDSVLTVATADALLHGIGFAEAYRRWYQRYPDAGYGEAFAAWASDPAAKPYGSWGNGSAMRVGPVGFFGTTLDDVLELARRSAAVTHDHPEGIRGAQAVAGAVFLAKSGKSKSEIAAFVGETFRYDLRRRLDDIRPGYGHDVSCAGSVPEAIVAFLESTSLEDAIRNAVSLGGDSDTLAAIAGAIGEAFYGMSRDMEARTLAYLDVALRRVVAGFRRYRGTRGSIVRNRPLNSP